VQTSAGKTGTVSTLRVIDRASFEKPPVVHYRVRPELTNWDRDTLRRFPSVAVEVGAVINEDGIPNEIEVLKSEDEEIGKAVVQAFQSWRFSPAIKEGRPAKSRVVLRMVMKDDGYKTRMQPPPLLRQI